MYPKVISSIKANVTRMAKLASLPNYTAQCKQANLFVAAECRRRKIKATYNEISSMATIIVRHL